MYVKIFYPKFVIFLCVWEIERIWKEWSEQLPAYSTGSRYDGSPDENNPQ